MSINDVMALRKAVLDRNAALRNVASTPASVANPGAGGRTAFEAAMNTVLQRSEATTSIGKDAEVGPLSQTGAARQGDFMSTLQAQLQKVNKINAQAGALTEAYERGQETDVAKVMLARQKSSIAFEATLQVRNKILSAYKDIMNMAV